MTMNTKSNVRSYEVSEFKCILYEMLGEIRLNQVYINCLTSFEMYINNISTGNSNTYLIITISV